ncbi:MAG: porin family protein [Hyphomicrobiales bacterium]|nr:porin family protein [Hyphomicrobiales bacterium]MCP4999506.1 porin family protein [Hyphomicrobiales bacterium]
MVKNLLRNSLLALPLIACAGVSQAADAVLEPAPAPAPVLAEPPGFWHGFYVGALVGYHHETVDTIPGNGSGVSVGGYVGGNYRFNNDIVVGVEGDYNAAFGSFDTFGWELASFGSVRGRIGYAMDRWHIYATGGLALADFDSQFAGLGDPDIETGWAAGGGVEYMITDNISARAEYLYMGFNDTFQDVGAPPGISTDIQNVRGGVAFHF